MQQMDCINQQARERGLTKRSQAERLMIADSLIASVWEEYLNGSIDRSTIQVAAYIQANVNRIVWKLNALNNPNTPNTLEALDCISRQAAIAAFDCTDELIICGSANAQNVMNYINKVIGKIKALPSAQPEIIRCKDCNWFGKAGCAIEIVDDSDKPTEDDYCSFAERRPDEKKS